MVFLLVSSFLELPRGSMRAWRAWSAFKARGQPTATVVYLSTGEKYPVDVRTRISEESMEHATHVTGWTRF